MRRRPCNVGSCSHNARRVCNFLLQTFTWSDGFMPNHAIFFKKVKGTEHQVATGCGCLCRYTWHELLVPSKFLARLHVSDLLCNISNAMMVDISSSGGEIQKHFFLILISKNRNLKIRATINAIGTCSPVANEKFARHFTENAETAPAKYPNAIYHSTLPLILH